MIRMTRVIHIETEPKRAEKILINTKSRKIVVLITKSSIETLIVLYMSHKNA